MAEYTKVDENYEEVARDTEQRLTKLLEEVTKMREDFNKIQLQAQSEVELMREVTADFRTEREALRAEREALEREQERAQTKEEERKRIDAQRANLAELKRMQEAAAVRSAKSKADAAEKLAKLGGAKAAAAANNFGHLERTLEEILPAAPEKPDAEKLDDAEKTTSAEVHATAEENRADPSSARAGMNKTCEDARGEICETAKRPASPTSLADSPNMKRTRKIALEHEAAFRSKMEE